MTESAGTANYQAPADPGAPAAAPPRPSGWAVWRRRLFSWDNLVITAVFGVVVGSWFLVSDAVGAQWVSSPSLVAHAFVTDARNGSLSRNTIATLKETIFGLVLGVLAGVVVGVLLGSAPALIRRGLYPYILGAYSLPRVALAPFFVLWFGIGLESKVFLVVSVVGFVVLFNVQQGLQAIDRDMVNVLRTMRAGPLQTIRYVVVPSLVPWIVSATKISVGLAVVSAVVGEMVGATEGLGWKVTFALSQADMTGAVSSLLVMSAMALFLYAIVALIERRILRWQAPAAGLDRQKTMVM